MKLRVFDLLNTAKCAGGSSTVANAEDRLVTPQMQDLSALPLVKTEGSFMEAAMFYRAGGSGFLSGPVGSAG